tara:strand:+ start:207 stop:422 length:216 start_codon:yes stop_codon:yes gene_type:complete
MTENYSAFKGLDLSNARNENETREEYKARLKANKQILKLYNEVGREKFQLMFPNGVKEALEASTEKLGEAK